jgi:hypothetical protein
MKKLNTLIFAVIFNIFLITGILTPLNAEAATQYSLTVSITYLYYGTGSGTITSSETPGPLINCVGSACQESADYDSGTVVNLTATPAEGSTFIGWTGACAGAGTCAVTMDADKEVMAVFMPDTTLGGIPDEGNLMITVLDDGSIGIYRFISGQWQNQIYGWDNKGSRLQINGAGYSLGYYYGLPAVPISNAKVSESQITSVWTAGGMRITLDLTYQNGASFMGLRWALTNESGNPMSDIRFFHGEDTYYFGNDRGAGYWDGPNNTIGVQRHISDELRRMSLQSVNTPYAYDSMYYWSVHSDVDAGALTNTIDANESTDNGYALEWRKDTMRNGETWTITAYEKFADVSVGTVSVTAPILAECNIGSTCDLAYTVNNISNSAANVNLSLISNDEWPAVIISPAESIIIPAGGSQAVIVRVTVPNNVSGGTISHITLNANDGAVTAGDTSAVKAVTTGFTLTIDKTGTGDGTVTSSEVPSPKINCGTGCNAANALYDANTQVILTATPDSNSTFIGSWSGACTGTGQCVITMDGNKSVTANFNLKTYTVTGTVTGGNGTVTCTSPVTHGLPATCTISPEANYYLAAFTDNGTSVISSVSNNQYTINNVTANHTINAAFAVNTYTVTTEAGQGGSVTPESTIVNQGGTAQFTISADNGYHIASVSGCGGTLFQSLNVTTSRKKPKNTPQKSSLSNSTYTTGPITADCTVTAEFAINTYTVTPSAGAHGGISPSARQYAAYNETLSFTITPDNHYHISSVTGCDGTLSGNTYTTGPVTQDCTVNAVFAIDTYGLAISTSGTGSGTITANGLSCTENACSWNFSYGARVVFKVKPDPGCRVADIRVDGVSIGAVTAITFKHMTGDHTIEIIFETV